MSESSAKSMHGKTAAKRKPNNHQFNRTVFIKTVLKLK